MNPKTAFLFILIISNFTVFSQEIWTITYDEYGSEMLTDTNDFSFKRVFSRISNSTASFTGYTNKDEKLESGTIKNDVLHGLYQYFYTNGTVNYEGEYKNGKPIGIWNEFYSNGNKKTQYKVSGESENDYQKTIISAWDSLGSPLVIEGKGRIIRKVENLLVHEDYEYGLLNNETKGYDNSKTLIFTERYKGGRLINGYNHISNTEYFSIYTLPEYNLGNEFFGKNIFTNVEKAYRLKLNNPKIRLLSEGQLEVFISVDEQGIVTDVELKSLKKSFITDIFKNAILSDETGWKPAMKRGTKIQSKFLYVFDFETKQSYFKKSLKISNSLTKYIHFFLNPIKF